MTKKQLLETLRTTLATTDYADSISFDIIHETKPGKERRKLALASAYKDLRSLSWAILEAYEKGESNV